EDARIIRADFTAAQPSQNPALGGRSFQVPGGNAGQTAGCIQRAQHHEACGEVVGRLRSIVSPPTRKPGPRPEGNATGEAVPRFCMWDDFVPHAESWDRLARGVPFRSWAWLSSWWRHYGSQSPDDLATRLMVLGALDASGRLAGIAPWYLKRSTAKGWVLRWLGSGEVCSDYASIL